MKTLKNQKWFRYWFEIVNIENFVEKLIDFLIRILMLSLKKKNRFIKINRHVFELLCEQKKWLHYQMLNDFQIEYWTISWFDIETIELKRENDCFVKKINRISICFRKK